MNQRKILAGCPLFVKMSDEEIEKVLKEIQVTKRKYQKGELLLCAGVVPGEFGIVLDGCIHILKEEFNGSSALIAQGEAGDIFGEAFVAAQEQCLVTVMAAKDCEIMWISFERMMKLKGAGREQEVFLENMMQILAKKNLFLAGRVSHLSRRTLKEKVLSYLGEQARQQGSRSFDIPFDRQGLADYLAADRSALSYVLGKLQKEGVLTFRKNHFTLLEENEHTEELEIGGWV